jgi:nucleotide-binding universal stress UspA family protein
MTTRTGSRQRKVRSRRVPAATHPVATPAAPAKPVLIATDGSTAAAAAIYFARLMADRGLWAPEAVMVLEPLPVAVPDIAMGIAAAPYDPSITGGVVGRVRTQLKRAGKASWEFTVQFGGVAPTIVRLARERQSKLIVLGLGHHGRLARFFGAETAARVCRHSDVPLLAIAPQTPKLPRVAVAAVDFGDSSVRAAREAVALLDPPARLHLVHVRWPTSHGMANDEWDRTYERGVAIGFERLTKELERPGVTVTTELLHGHVIETLLEQVAQLNAGLLAVGSHSQTVVDRLLIGFTAAELLRSARCSVLVAPPEMKT